jgi:predicted RNA-binding protein (virulence factor B family)
MELENQVKIGRPNRLRVLKSTPHGLFLQGEQLGEILLPKRYVQEGMEVGDDLEVFVYRDSEDRWVATTEQPYAWVGEFGLFEVVGFTPGVGAFLDWGLSKDLLLPLREQAGRLEVGDWVVAAVVVDPVSERIVASTRLNRHVGKTPVDYVEGQAVRLLVAERSPLGFKAIIENAHWGLLYANEVPSDLELGQALDGYIRRVRSDGKIDLSLDRAGYDRVGPISQQILGALEAEGGRLAVGDDTSPEEIRARFSCSKKAFKQALGLLFRGGQIRFVSEGIEKGNGEPPVERSVQKRRSSPRDGVPGRRRSPR